MIRAFGLLAVILALSPLIGLSIMLIQPPPDPFGGPTPNLSNIIGQIGILGLLIRSMLLSFLTACLATIFGLWLAFIEQRREYRGKKPLMLLGLMVLATPSYILAGCFSSSSLIFFDGFAAALLCLTLVCIPYVQLTISSAFSRISRAEEEAALSLGASSWRAFQVATLPQIRSSIAFSFLISFLYAISDFGAVATLDVPVLTWRLFESVRTQDLSQAAALGLAVIVATIPAFLLAQRLKGGPRLHHIGNPRPPHKEPLTSWSLWGNYAVHGLLIGLGLILPLYELSSWIIDGLNRDLTFISQWDAILGSLLYSALGAGLTVALVLSPAWLSVQQQFYQHCTYLASALPGVLLAFGLMATAIYITKYTGGYGLLLSSGALLFLGYAMRFIAEAFGPIATAMNQLNPKLRHSAQSLNAYPFPWFQKVLLPHIGPSIWTSLLIVFLACIKELPITLLLGGATGTPTLAFRSWDRYNEGLWQDAGVSSLCIFVIALLLTALTLKWKRNA